MDPIQDAIAAIDAPGSGQQLSYRKASEIFEVLREKLRCQHQGVQRDRAGANLRKRKLSPDEEVELVVYIETLTKRGLSPTREMISNFASEVAKLPCLQRWVSRFLAQNQEFLSMKWT
jgi:hypothetical protein